jgi:hypothetical protein
VSQSPCDDAEPVPPWDAFSRDGTADAPPPGPGLAALLGDAVANLGELDERQLLGAGSAARRLKAHADYLEVMAVAEFARRRAEQLEASKARGDRLRSRDAEYPAEELGFEMTASAHSAAILLDMAASIAGRLPSTLAAMAAGVIDRDRARTISNATLHLPDDLAAEADKVLAEAAPQLRLADLHKKAARLEARLDPEGVQKRKDEARRDRRVELRREDSGAACLSGRELDPAEALAGKASIDSEAVRLRNAGLPGTLAQIRAVILIDRIHQRSPWDRLAPPPPEPEPEPDADAEPGDDPDPCDDDAPAGPYEDDVPADAVDDEDGDQETAAAAEEEEEDEGRPAGLAGGAPPGSPGDRTGRKTPMPALVNITIPAGTLLGWSGAPADVGTWGPIYADAARDLIEAASRHPRTRWCCTLTGPDGQAIAHACAPGPRPLGPAPPRPRRPRRPRRPPAGAARRAPDPAERRPRADRPGNLRPRPPPGPLHPRPEAQAPHPRPHRPLLRPRLRRPGHHQRDRPHHPPPRRRHLPVQPRPRVPAPPPRQARTRLETPADPARHHALDHPLRPHLHHPPHPIRRVMVNPSAVSGGTRSGPGAPGFRSG